MTDYKYEKCVDCVHAHMDKDGNHDCGFEDCVSESDKRYSDDTPFESYCSCYDCFQKMVELEKKNAELKEQNANLIAMLKAEREVRVNDDYLKGICERDAEIDDLKEQLECAEHNCKVKQEFNDNQFKAIMDFKERAKEIIKTFVDHDDSYWSIQKRAEEFLKECQ